jgi:hypothetical protein
VSGYLDGIIDTLTKNNIQNNINQSFFNNSISGLIYNLPNYGNDILSLSGLIYNIKPGIDGKNGINGVDGVDGKNGKDSGGASSGGSIGAIIDGIAILGLGSAVAFGFSTVFASLATIQAQIGAIQAELFIADNQIVSLQVANTSLTSQVVALEALVTELQVKTIFLNGNIITCPLFIVIGNLEVSSPNPFGFNVFTSNTTFAENIFVAGYSYSTNALGIPQFFT